MTRAKGPTATQRRIVADRAGYRCEVCGRVLALAPAERPDWVQAHSFHHRQPRGMGGSRAPGRHAAHQLLLVCGSGTTGCHGLIESQRALAYSHGWLVKHPIDPATVPVTVYGQFAPVLLTADGEYQEAA